MTLEVLTHIFELSASESKEKEWGLSDFSHYDCIILRRVFIQGFETYDGTNFLVEIDVAIAGQPAFTVKPHRFPYDSGQLTSTKLPKAGKIRLVAKNSDTSYPHRVLVYITLEGVWNG